MHKREKTGISLRLVHVCLIVLTVIMSGIVLYSTYRLTSSFLHMKEATEQYMELEKAAHELMDASDYLTERVQRFTLNGNTRFMDEYFTEAFETNRREDALATLGSDENSRSALARLQEAMNGSLRLMEREYYAMRLVIEAKGYTDYPDVLKDVKLNSGDLKLSAEDKMKKASSMVLDDEYYYQKDSIRSNMRESLWEIDMLIRNIEEKEQISLHKDSYTVRLVIVIQIFSILVMVWLTSSLGIQPVLKAVDNVKANEPIPEVGANEFIYLAQAYNKMYATYKKSLEQLNYQALHDELTGAYNRAGYDLLLTSIDLETTCMLMFDVDNFKEVNDTYGHEAGDKILQKIVHTFKSIFRDDDYICRIGGDEFVVFMVRSSAIKKKQLEFKIEQINRILGDTEDGLPAISVSVGIVYGKDASDMENLFEKSDAAMYESKKHGKHTVTIYSDNDKIA